MSLLFVDFIFVLFGNLHFWRDFAFVSSVKKLFANVLFMQFEKADSSDCNEK